MSSVSKADSSAAEAAKKFYADAVSSIMEGDVAELDRLVREFLKVHKDVTLEDIIMRFHSEGKTFLHLAASTGNYTIVESIISQSANPTELINLADIMGMTPFINATISESSKIMNYFISLGADVNARNKDGAGALHFAAGDGSVERLTILVNANVDLTAVSTSGTALHWACGKGRGDAVRYLLEKDCPLDIQGSGGLPAIILAAASFSDECVSLLVQAGADLGFIVTGNLTVLHLAAENGLELSVKSILESPNESGRSSCTIPTDDDNLPLHLAAMGGHRSIVELLLPFSPISALPNAGVHIGPESLASLPNTPFKTELLNVSSSEDQLIEDIMADGKVRLAAWEDKYMAEDKEEAPSLPKPGKEEPVLPDLTPITDPAIIERVDELKVAGNAHFREKEFSRAIECYRQAIELFPSNEVLWSNSSAAKLSAGDYDGALHDAEVCRRLKPEWTKGCFRLAAARLALEMYEEAAIAAFEGTKLDQDNADLKSILREAVKQGQLAHQAKLARENSM